MGLEEPGAAKNKKREKLTSDGLQKKRSESHAHPDDRAPAGHRDRLNPGLPARLEPRRALETLVCNTFNLLAFRFPVRTPNTPCASGRGRGTRATAHPSK